MSVTVFQDFPLADRDREWDGDAADKRVRKWRNAAGLTESFVLYAMRHRFYTTAVGRGGLTADQAGAIGGTSGAVVRSTYLQQEIGPIFEGASKVREAGRSRSGG